MLAGGTPVSLLKFLGLAEKDEPAAADADAIRAIAAELDRLDPARARYVAAFAYLLGRLAHVDSDVSEAETRAMEQAVAEHAGIPEPQAVLTVQIARGQNRLFGGTEDFLVTREFAKMATQEQKLALLNCLFAVSSADQAIAVVEDNEIRQIAREIRVEHRDFIAVRSAYRRHLNVLKPSARRRRPADQADSPSDAD